MTTPGAGPFLSGPRRADETAAQYRNRRNLEVYGKSTYDLRIERAMARGLSRTAARGHATTPEHPILGPGIDLVFPSAIELWLTANGYTPESTGLTRPQLLRIGRRLRWINENSAPGNRITPEMMYQARQLELNGTLRRGWVFERLRSKYAAMYAWREYRENGLGQVDWAERNTVRANVPELPDAWWTYH